HSGKYELQAYGGEDSDIQIDRSVNFDVVDHDVDGIVVKISRGGTISGSLFYEGPKNDAVPKLLSETWIAVRVHQQDCPGSTSGRSYRMKPDGSFVAAGLPAGTVYFSFENPAGLSLLRVERDGAVQTNGIQIQKHERISGIRLIVSYSNGSIRGTVKFENGPLPADVHV